MFIPEFGYYALVVQGVCLPEFVIVCAFRKIIAKCLQGDDVGLNVLKLWG